MNAEKAPPKVLAYSVETNDPEESTIQFATSNAAARRQGADEISTDFSGIVYCRRAHWADPYADQRFIPAKAGAWDSITERAKQIGYTSPRDALADLCRRMGQPVFAEF